MSTTTPTIPRHHKGDDSDEVFDDDIDKETTNKLLLFTTAPLVLELETETSSASDTRPSDGSGAATGANTVSGRQKVLIVIAMVAVVVVSIMASGSGNGGGSSTASGVNNCANKANSDSKDRAILMTNHINCIKLSDATLTVPQSYTPFAASTISAEQAALSWLIHKDPLPLLPDTATNRLRLQQRYAVLTMLVQIEYEDVEPTLSKRNDECNWSPFVKRCIESTEPTTLGTNVVTKIVIDYASTLPGSTLSPDLGLLSNLESFNAYFAGLTGSLPLALGTTWTNLAKFDARGNALTGSLPSSLGTAWTNLTYFAVLGNALTGSLPATLGTSWTTLTTFDVSDNDLTGSLPASLGTTWTNLAKFYVHGNALTGSLRSSLGTTWTNIVYFVVWGNDLTGSLPSSLGSTWNNLTILYVSGNALTGTIPNEMASYWNNLQYAYFHNNSLVGSMPSGFCAVATLTDLYADCIDEVSCSCCTDCCSDTTGLHGCVEKKN